MSRINNILIPSVTDITEKGIERSYDIFSRLLKERIVFFTEEVDTIPISVICASLLHLEAEDATKPIQLYINSPGGSVYDCVALIDVMEYVSCPIYTIGSGLVASAAAIILACGDKRFATKHCRIMIHQPWGGLKGRTSDLLVGVNEYTFMRDILIEMLHKKTGQTIEKLLADMEKDKYMSSQDALEYGLIDEILTKKVV